MSESRHSVRFPGESENYRAARNELLEAEIQLRRNIEDVAAKRRDLPPGGKIQEDYVFDEPSRACLALLFLMHLTVKRLTSCSA